MKFLMNKLDRFCYRHPGFGIPNLMLVIVIGQAIVFCMDLVSNYTFSALLDFYWPYILHGQVWRAVTFIFIPFSNNIFYFLISALFYGFFLGRTLERSWGTAKFTIYFGVGWLMSVLVGIFTSYATTSYVCMSMLLAYATLYPNDQINLLLFFVIPIPIKAKWLGWLYGGLTLLSVAGAIWARNWATVLMIVISLFNYLLFFWSDLMFFLGRTKRANSRNAVNFRRATQKAQKQKGYLHKCSVCGKTDTDYPDLEFRYCSRCVGYYCYCIDHINNHIHITE